MHPGPAAPPPSHPRAALVVAVGGVVGSLLRAAADEALPHGPTAWAWSTLLVNALGGFALGALVGALARRGGSAYARLLFGTGVLGGFTTFSTFSVEVVQLVEAGRAGTAAAYVVVSTGVLLVAAAAGLRALRPSGRAGAVPP